VGVGLDGASSWKVEKDEGTCTGEACGREEREGVEGREVE
jgi:hypothetical protein